MHGTHPWKDLRFKSSRVHDGKTVVEIVQSKGITEHSKEFMEKQMVLQFDG